MKIEELKELLWVIVKKKRKDKSRWFNVFDLSIYVLSSKRFELNSGSHFVSFYKYVCKITYIWNLPRALTCINVLFN